MIDIRLMPFTTCAVKLKEVKRKYNNRTDKPVKTPFEKNELHTVFHGPPVSIWYFYSVLRKGGLSSAPSILLVCLPWGAARCSTRLFAQERTLWFRSTKDGGAITKVC